MVTANNVPITPVHRVSTGIDVLDWMWGSSQFGTVVEWGFPVGKLTLLPGEGGLGKTRLCVALTRSLLRCNPCATVLYFQNEALPSDLVTIFDEPDARVSSRLDIESASALDDQIQKIRVMRPTLAIMDSITMIDEFEDGMNGKKVKEVVQRYRETANDTNAHVLFISHVTKRGDTKGSTMLPHLVDSIFRMRREKGRVGFVVETGKHRYGLTGLKSFWEYKGPLPTGSPSEEMFDDPLWTRDHSMVGYERPFDLMAYIDSPEYQAYMERIRSFDDPSQGCWLRRKATQAYVTILGRINAMSS